MEQKKGFKRNQFAGLLAALFCIVVFNSILIIKDQKQNTNLYASIDFANPLSLFSDGGSKADYTIPADKKEQAKFWVATTKSNKEKTTTVIKNNNNVLITAPALPTDNMIVNVAQNDVEASLTNEQKEKVKSTVDATKKVFGDLQWKQVETVIGEVLTDKEKVVAKKEYLDEMNKKVDWKNVEQNMKAQYQNIDWEKIDNKMNNALTAIQLDSLQKTYTVMLTQLNKLTTEVKEKAEVNVCPLPDQSIEQIQQTKEVLSSRVNTIKALRSPKKVVRL
jgi:hypothetical protein